MKQFLLTSALALCTAFAYAETETNLTLVEGHTLLVSELDGLGAADTDIVRFYINNTSGESREGWGIGGFANSDNWTPTVEWIGKAGDSWTYDYTVADIKTAAGTTAGQYHDVGITINIYNGCVVDHVVLVADIVAPTEEVLWEGEYTFDESWSGSVSIGKLDVKAGDKIVITAEPVAAQTWEWGGQIFVKSLADGWGAIAPTVAVPEAGTYTVDVTDSDITVEPYNMNPYTSNMVKEITEFGLVLQGIDAKVTKVVLVRKAEVVPSENQTLWEGEYTFDESWSGSVSIGKFDVVAGDKLVITAEPVEAVSWEWGGQVFVKSLADGWGAIAPTVAVSQADAYTVEITDSEITVEPYNADPYTTTMVKELTEYGLVLQGIDAKVTKVELIKNGSTIDEVEFISPAKSEVYNISGQKMTSAKGLCIVNGKLIMVK